MFTVTVQIDDKKVVSVDTNGVDTLPEQKDLMPNIRSHGEPREIHSFMMDGVQYCKAKDSYWFIAPYDMVSQISKSRYYNVRKRAGYGNS